MAVRLSPVQTISLIDRDWQIRCIPSNALKLLMFELDAGGCTRS